MKLCTFYTDSHKSLLNTYLKPSIEKYLPPISIDYIEKKGEQKCQSAIFKQKGWTDTTKEKILSIVEVLESSVSEIVIYADADIICLNNFLQDCTKEIAEYDILCQRDGKATYCTGFMVIKSNDKTISLFNDVASQINQTNSDQYCFNRSIQSGKHDIKINFLNYQYLNLSHFKTKIYNEKDKFPNFDPTKYNIFHANWIKGVDNKDKLLNYVDRYNKAYMIINNICDRGQMSYDEYSYISNHVYDKNIIVFGCGKDSDIWRILSKKVLFIEHNHKYITNRNDTILVNYNTSIEKDFQNLLQQIKEQNYSVLYMPEIESLLQQDWDTIIVDAPDGYCLNSTGRMKSIYIANKLANKNTDIFIHDMNRQVEREFSQHIFGDSINTIHKLGHFRKII